MAPPEPRTLRDGDGQWTRFGSDGDRAGSGAAIVYRTSLHPHPTSRFVSVTIAAVDLCGVRVGYVPGSADVPNVDTGGLRGLVPESDQSTLIAIFNGGWKPEHGHFGMYSSGVSLVPARDHACTVGIDSRGHVRIASEKPDPATLSAYRQTPPCLFERGILAPELARNSDAAWGGHDKGVTTRRRSALGIDDNGRFLFYAVGEEAAPKELATALLAVGAVSGVELDINWYWTRFLLFGDSDGTLHITSSLVKGMEYQARSYVERPSDRDFFYIAR